MISMNYLITLSTNYYNEQYETTEERFGVIFFIFNSLIIIDKDRTLVFDSNIGPIDREVFSLGDDFKNNGLKKQ